MSVNSRGPVRRPSAQLLHMIRIPALQEALTHRFRLEHHGVLIAQMLAHVDFLEASIAETHQRVEVLLRPVADMVELVMTIPGVGRRVAEVLIAEVGLDMTVFPTAGHLASWAGICPGNNSSGGKRRPGAPGTARCGCGSR